MSERCETCRYILRHEAEHISWSDGDVTKMTVWFCRRYPDGPRKMPKDWCGEWRAKENEGDQLPPNPNLDAAAAMGGMGGEQPRSNFPYPCDCNTSPGTMHKPGCIFWEWNANTCPVCHTPGGEHAPECQPCPICEEKAPHFCSGPCRGVGRVLVEDKEK